MAKIKINRIKTVILNVVFPVLIAGCAAKNPYYDPLKSHHTPEGFKNNYQGAISKSLSDWFAWKWQDWTHGLPPKPQHPTPAVQPNLALIQSYGKQTASGVNLIPAATWIGHSTVLMQAGGLNVLTDPIFSERASPVQFFGPKRAQPPGVALKDLPPIDVVLISHNHNDHLDLDSVIALNERSQTSVQPTLFLVPLGVKPWLEKYGIKNVIELDWWQKYSVKGVEFYLTPVQHWSARGLTDRSHTLWGGWAVFSRDFQWYFSGDTGYSKDFVDTKSHFISRQTPELGGGFDLSFIAVGAYEPRWFMKEQHINPSESVKIHQDLGSKQSIGIHWGTFELTDEALDQPPKDLSIAKQNAGIKDDEFLLLKIGETRQFRTRITKNGATTN